ncbi:hypothetical protein MKW94_016146 [Papaver nudicaule]|uniref:RING-type E3 ubiquitin transferase n=1 Tax=Papaver nudicaule TaxID=74823 RepID=A0AA41V620_PAPNU|nr:hypothetical protein [Papaver nudicaule]
MNHKRSTGYIISTIVLLLWIQAGRAQSQPVSADDYYGPPMPDMKNISFRPSVAVVIGILAVMFALTFLLLIYAKFCHIAVSTHPVYVNNFRGHLHDDALISTSRSSRFSGIDKTLIESLPFFKFSALKGSKQGLECAVCLSKFEDTEVLRLLPKCKHAFHINCVDQWLESHSSCPLCRHKVQADDLSMFKLSNSSRLSHNPSSLDLRADPNIELFVQREQDHEQYLGSSSSRFSIGSSFRKNETDKKYFEDQELLILNAEDGSTKDHQEVHSTTLEEHNCELDKFKHKIIVSDIVYKNRWSNVSSSDLMSLNSELLNFMSSKRFSSSGCSNSNFGGVGLNVSSSITNGHEGTAIPTMTTTSSRSTFLNSATTKRSMSEITSISRLSHLGLGKIRRVESDNPSGNEERISRIWFPIMKKTVGWVSGRDKRMQQPHDHEDQQRNSGLVAIV